MALSDQVFLSILGTDAYIELVSWALSFLGDFDSAQHRFEPT